MPGGTALPPAVVGLGAAGRRMFEEFEIVGVGRRGQGHERGLVSEPSLVARCRAAARSRPASAQQKIRPQGGPDFSLSDAALAFAQQVALPQRAMPIFSLRLSTPTA